jgi:2-methylcitrate dehydratase PrpD
MSFGDLQGDVIETVRNYILDDFATAYAGAFAPWVDMVAHLAEESTSGPCSLFGRKWTTSPSSAALINGVCVGGFEANHGYSAGSCHPSAAVFPAVLAIAEQQHLDGKTFLAAVAVGYESLCRVGAAATRAVEDERGFHGPGINAAIGAAIGTGRALGFDAETLTNAIGIAASHAGGLVEFIHDGAMTKRLHAGRGSQLGLECALLAEQGFTGPSTAIEGEEGFLRAYSPSPKPAVLLEGLGDRYLLKNLALKAYPCHQAFQGVVEAIQAFRQTMDFHTRDLDAVTIISRSRLMEPRFANSMPTTLMGAQTSLPWSTALALSQDVRKPSVWATQDLDDSELQRVAQMVELRPDTPGGPGISTEIELVIRGQTYKLGADDWKGSETNPCSFQDIAQKLVDNMEGRVSSSRSTELIERISDLEAEADVARLASLIRG